MLQKFNLLKSYIYAFKEGGEGDGGGAGNEDPKTDPKTGNEPAKTGKTNEPEKGVDELAEAKAALKAEKLKSERLEREAKDKADAEKKAKMDDKEKAVALEKENADLKRENMINRVRFQKGYTSELYDDIAVKGDTEAEVEACFETFKTKLDKANVNADAERKPGQGKATGGGKPSGKDDATPLAHKLFPDLGEQHGQRIAPTSRQAV